MPKQISILLVDDEADFLASMSYWLEAKGFAVQSVSNGPEAIKRIKLQAPDIIFLDIIMPEMDGATVVQKIREFNKNLPVILMSAYVQESRDEKKDNFYGVSRIFYKDDGFAKALSLLEAELKIKHTP